MTPSIARAVSKYFHDETPIRLCYMGNTFINYDKYQGRLKETTQMGAELMEMAVWRLMWSCFRC